MQKIIILISKIILVIAFLNIFVWYTCRITNSDRRSGIFDNVLKEFAMFPDVFIKIYGEILDPERLLIYDSDFQPSNKLEYDIFALNATFDSPKWVIRLLNLRNDSIIYKWYLDRGKYLNTGRAFSHAEPRNPILLNDTSIIINNDETRNLYRLDANSEIIWHNSDYQLHHSINLDNDGNIWACTYDIIPLTGFPFEYKDNCLTKFDIHSGKTLYHKSLSEILIDNNLSYLLHGYANGPIQEEFDPLHLNDIQPVLKGGTFWDEGDLFLSLRNRSMILLYRPSTNKIIRIIQGPFFKQHDIDILSDSTISLFNNNITIMGQINDPKQDSHPERKLFPNSHINLLNEVLVYNLNDSSFTSLYPEQFLKNDILSKTNGIHHILSNGGLFVESTKQGKFFIFNANETLLKKYVNQPVNGHVEYPHWVRIYENLNFLK